MSHGTASRLLILFISQWIGFSIPAYSRTDSVPGSRYTSGRAASLGDAYLPLADDGAAALFYNPAALGLLKKPKAEVFNWAFEANNDYVTSSGVFNFYKVMNLSTFAAGLSEAKYTYQGIMGQFTPNFSMKGFGFGMMLKSSLLARNEGDKVYYRTLYQLVPAAGFGIRLAKGIVRIGYSAQWVNQTVGSQYVDTAAATHWGEGANQGSGISHNVGYALTLPLRYFPALNVVARNVGGVNYSSRSLVQLAKNSPGPPPREKMSLDASVSFHPKIKAPSAMNFVVQYRDMSNTSQTHLLTRVVGSFEIGIKGVLFFRAGMGSGYPSAGFGLRTENADFSLGWYSEELGKEFHEHRDARYVLQYQARVF